MSMPLARAVVYAWILCLYGALNAYTCAATDPLPSWNDTAAKTRLMTFIAQVTDTNSTHFVAPDERIATFDNDGTLWVEQPAYVQMMFLVDHVKALAPQHPKWQNETPFKDLLAGNLSTVSLGDERDVTQLIMATHAGMTTETFQRIVTQWIGSARHPRFRRPYTDLAYQPMLELLQFLRAKGFKTFVVSGGGVEFMRPWTERVYGIPPEQVIGSSIKLRYQIDARGVPQLQRLPAVDLINDGPGKPAGIERVIGRQPILAFGNSDGDREMLEWCAAGAGEHLAALIHHTDATREWAYDHDSRVGKLDTALREAREKNWLVIDMKADWKHIFRFEAQ
jgi:hypothetical protein